MVLLEETRMHCDEHQDPHWLDQKITFNPS
jgi:hypothetical protein